MKDACWCRVAATWGDSSLVHAFRNLLKAALEDPRNTKFVHVSESCVPLRHPAVLWSQHVAESHISRVKLIPHWFNTPGTPEHSDNPPLRFYVLSRSATSKLFLRQRVITAMLHVSVAPARQ